MPNDSNRLQHNSNPHKPVPKQSSKSPKSCVPKASKSPLPCSEAQIASGKSLPIPKGTTPYALAKNAEYQNRDLNAAEFFYQQAIAQGDRTESAVKDLASLLHQRGKTIQACELLEKYSFLFKNDLEKYKNLYNTLKKQIDPTGNCQNKNLKIFPLAPEHSRSEILNFFANAIRIKNVVFDSEEIDGKVINFAILYFNSHSSARKTLEGFKNWDKFKVEWVSPLGEVVGDAHYARQKMEEYRKYHPTFDYVVFERDPHGYVLSLPLEGSRPNIGKGVVKADEQKNAKLLLGNTLYSMIFNEDDFKDL